MLYEILIPHRSSYHLDMARRAFNFLWLICDHLVGEIIRERLKPTLRRVRNIPDILGVLSFVCLSKWYDTSRVLCKV